MRLAPAQYLEGEAEQEWLVPVEHLSATSLGMLARCPEQFRHRYVLGEKERPGEGLVIGTAVHLAVERNFTQKVESREDIPPVDMLEWFEDEGFARALAERGDEDEVAWDKDSSPDNARIRGKAIVAAYQQQVAPRVQPLSAEERVEADFGLPVPVIGYSDCRTDQAVIDVKTGKQARKEIKPEWRMQSAIYGTIVGLPVDFHVAAATAKDHRATVLTPLEAPELSVWMTPEAREETQRNVRAMGWMANHFMRTLGPDEPWPTLGITHPWACSWCAWKPVCPAWAGMAPQ